ncbi:hypothetical protein BTA51_14000 [Hahella sp. CCB-MM4]|uniref:hypothetical protein n=1 Tax=Hahella sp. (strain CCB-MM4) TaxID=1926491 RepID=UPI000B9AA132|nr:hypothetical protein [Hahella sp. CCB-MM4]OZG72638.1 hypothetical protein BTA51_14000 [Hahella sp. CCB-MM4]
MEINRHSAPNPATPDQIHEAARTSIESAPARLGENTIRAASPDTGHELSTPDLFKRWAENHDLNLTGFPDQKVEQYSHIIAQDLERKNLNEVLSESKSTAGHEAQVKALFEKLNLQEVMGKPIDPGVDLSSAHEVGKLSQAIQDILDSKLDHVQQRVFNANFNPPREKETAIDHLDALNQMKFALKQVNKLAPSKFSKEAVEVVKPLAKHVANRIVQQERQQIKDEILDKIKFLNQSGSSSNLALEMDLGVEILNTPLKATVNLSHKEVAQTSQALGVLRERSSAGKLGFEIKIPVIEAGPSVGASLNLSRTSGRGFDNVSDFVDHFTDCVLDLTLSSPTAAKSARALKQAVASDSEIIFQSDQMKQKLQNFLSSHGEGVSSIDTVSNWRDGNVELALPEARQVPASATYKAKTISYGGFGKFGFTYGDIKGSYEHKHTFLKIKGEASLTSKMLDDEDLLKSRTENFVSKAKDGFFSQLDALKSHLEEIEQAREAETPDSDTSSQGSDRNSVNSPIPPESLADAMSIRSSTSSQDTFYTAKENFNLSDLSDSLSVNSETESFSEQSVTSSTVYYSMDDADSIRWPSSRSFSPSSSPSPSPPPSPSSSSSDESSIISETSRLSSSENQSPFDLVRNQLKEMATTNFEKLLTYESTTRSADTLTKGTGKITEGFRKMVGMPPKYSEPGNKRDMESQIGVKGRASFVEGLTVRHANIFNEFVRTYDGDLEKAREQDPETVLALETMTKHFETPEMKFSKKDFAQIRALERSQPKERSHTSTFEVSLGSTLTAIVEYTRRTMKNNANINYNGTFNQVKVTFKGNVGADSLNKLGDILGNKVPELSNSETLDALAEGGTSVAATRVIIVEYKDDRLNFSRHMQGTEAKVGGGVTIPADSTVTVAGKIAANREQPYKESIGTDNLTYFKTQFDGLVTRKTITDKPKEGDGWEEMVQKYGERLEGLLSSMANPASTTRKQIEELFKTCEPHATEENMEKATQARDDFFSALDQMKAGPGEDGQPTVENLKKDALTAFRTFLYEFKGSVQKDYEKAVKSLS